MEPLASIGFELKTWQGVFLAGCLGAFLIEFVQWYNLKNVPNGDDYKWKPLYWFTRAIAIIVGGLITLLVFGSSANSILAFGIGAGWPTVIKKSIALALSLFEAKPVAKIDYLEQNSSSLRSYLRI